MKIIVDKDKCPQDHKCPAMRICPVGAITQKDIYSLPVINEELCILCKKCIVYCPMKAFKIKSDT